MRHQIVRVTIAVLPVVVFWMVWPHLDPGQIVTETPRSAPQWVEDGHQYSTCSAAMSGTPVPGRRVAVDAVRAARIGAGVIESQTTLNAIFLNASLEHRIVAFTPFLVQRTFADGQSRLAWVYGEGRVTDNIGMSATVEVVYIDASTGDPLLLIRDIFAGDPNFSCPQVTGIESMMPSVYWFTGGILVTLLYVVIAGIAVLFIWRKNRRDTRTKAV